MEEIQLSNGKSVYRAIKPLALIEMSIDQLGNPDSAFFSAYMAIGATFEDHKTFDITSIGMTQAEANIAAMFRISHALYDGGFFWLFAHCDNPEYDFKHLKMAIDAVNIPELTAAFIRVYDLNNVINPEFSRLTKYPANSLQLSKPEAIKEEKEIDRTLAQSGMTNKFLQACENYARAHYPWN